MKPYHCFAVVASLLFATACTVADEKAKSTKWDFHDAKVGSVPKGWIAGVTGSKKGKAPRWEVIRDEDHVVLAQLESGGANGDFPVCLKQGSSLKDGSVTIRFKPISGKVDQAGGVVFRAKDKDNFYIARANALENNVSFYVTHEGRRKTIKYWDDVPVPLGKWHELKVEVNGFTFKVSLNGKLVGVIEDTAQTFPDAGMVGFWTKADSVTYFDDLTVSAAEPAKQALRLVSAVADAAPLLDGKGDDKVWSRAKPLKVVARRVLPPNVGTSATVEIRSVHTDTHLYFLVTWEDGEASVSHKTWVWNPDTKRYDEGKDREDMFALGFEHSGTFNVNMLSGDTATWDVWHWKAFRTNPQGYAMDKSHHYTLEKPGIKAKSYEAKNGKTIWIARPEDAGDTVERKQPAPTKFKGNKVVQYLPGKPSGSAADVHAKGAWSDGRWTLELGRKLNTGHPRDDTFFHISRAYMMALSTFDHTGSMDKASGLIELTWADKVAN